MKNIFWAAYSNEERNTAIHKIQTLVLKFGDIVDFKFFSDMSLTVTIEIKECNIDKLYDELKDKIGLDKYEYLSSSLEKERTIFLNITFSKGTGNLKVETPSVPG